MGRNDSSPAIHRRESGSQAFVVPSGTTDRLTLAMTFSVVPLGLRALYWSHFLYPAINHRATFGGSYGTMTAFELTPMPVEVEGSEILSPRGRGRIGIKIRNLRLAHVGQGPRPPVIRS